MITRAGGGGRHGAGEGVRTRVLVAPRGQADGDVTPRKRADAIMASMDRQQEFVLRTLEERDIRFVRLWCTDVSGYLKAVAVAPAEIEAAFAEGIGFDGSAIEGFARVYESDMLAKPDPGTFQVMPAAKGQASDTARMFCDLTLPDGSPSWADPRQRPRAGRHRRLLRPLHPQRRPRLPPGGGLRAGGDGDLGGVQPPRGRA